MPYRYYDTPEGEDMVPKLWFMTKSAAAAGFVAGVWDVTYYSHPKSYVVAAARFAHFTWPFVGMAAAYTAVTNTLIQSRQTDDLINPALGGLAAGLIFGAWRKKLGFGLTVGTCLAIVAMAQKDAVQSGYELLPENGRIQYSTCSSWRTWDYSTTPELPGHYRVETVSAAKPPTKSC